MWCVQFRVGKSKKGCNLKTRTCVFSIHLSTVYELVNFCEISRKILRRYDEVYNFACLSDCEEVQKYIAHVIKKVRLPVWIKKIDAKSANIKFFAKYFTQCAVKVQKFLLWESRKFTISQKYFVIWKLFSGCYKVCAISACFQIPLQRVFANCWRNCESFALFWA